MGAREGVLDHALSIRRASATAIVSLAETASTTKADRRFVSQRTRGVSVVFWVDFDCRERVYRRLEPGETWVSSTYEAHPFRDETGTLLVDFPANTATAPDHTVFVSLP